jgi:tetratricopeptide (TPR) repeat protein
MIPNLQYAIKLHQQGQLDQAAQIYQQLIQVNGRDADAHNLLGAIWVAKKQYQDAVKHLNKAVKLAPKYASAQYNLGKCYIDMGEPKRALGPLLNAVRLDKNMLDAMFLLANCQIQLGMLDDAVLNYEKVLEVAPEHIEALNNLGNAWQDLVQPEKALDYHRRALKVAPEYLLAMLSLAEALRNLDRQNEAIELLNQALQVEHLAEIYQSLGVNYQQIGDMQNAKQSYLKAIELNNKSGRSYRGYTEVYKLQSAEELELIQQAGAFIDDEDERSHWHFAMGHGHDVLKQYDQAIVHYDQANAAHRKFYKYNTSESQSLFKSIKDTYKADFVNDAQALGNQGEGAIFVLGMPRSGTSLVEQIIASHSSVTGAGELSKIDGFAKSYKQGPMKFHKQVPRMQQAQLAAMANDYMEYLHGLSEGSPVITDKLPHNFLYIGLIRKILPKAKIVHCKRHPVANCLSIYKAFFSSKGSHKYAYNQKELAEYHNLYEDLMEHWRKELPGQFYEIKYEELTSNQEEESRKLIDYCGLEWEEACLDFHKTKRKVKTASAYQVRQPMSNKSVALWKKYGDGLKPLIDNLYIPEEYQE